MRTVREKSARWNKSSHLLRFYMKISMLLSFIQLASKLSVAPTNGTRSVLWTKLIEYTVSPPVSLPELEKVLLVFVFSYADFSGSDIILPYCRIQTRILNSGRWYLQRAHRRPFTSIHLSLVATSAF